MGSAASKPAGRTAAAAAAAAAGARARRYPSQPSPMATQKTRQGRGGEESRAEGVDGASLPATAAERDGRDPHFAAVLRTIGAVNPTPTFSNSSIAADEPVAIGGGRGKPGASSTPVQSHSAAPAPAPAADHPPPPPPARANPTLDALRSRTRLAEAADQEALSRGMRGHVREFLDVQTIKQALVLRDRHGVADAQIEHHLRLKPGVLGSLGPRGIVRNVDA